jgi:GNAT superfamily N-acetyltransferase
VPGAVVRPAVTADAALLPAVERLAASAFWALPELAWLAEGEVMDAGLQAAAIADGTCWVADGGGGTLAGFLCAERCDETLHIREVSVRHDCQGAGIGGRLVAAAVAHARALGLAAVTLTTFRAVPWNAPFYARLGFVEADDARLRAELEADAAHGLPAAGRCAMRLAL